MLYQQIIIHPIQVYSVDQHKPLKVRDIHPIQHTPIPIINNRMMIPLRMRSVHKSTYHLTGITLIEKGEIPTSR
jgi:hypothetical protein